MSFSRPLFAVLALVVGCFSTSVFAQIVTLNSIDGSITMKGELIGFDGEQYTVRTAVGQISLSVENVVCEGEFCPELVIDSDEFTISGSNAIGATLLPTLIEAFALERGGDLQIDFGSDGTSTYFVMDPNGDIHSTITIVPGSSDDGFAALADGSAVIALSSRPASASEISSFAAAGFGDLSSSAQEKIVALDGIIAVVHRDNPVTTLSLSQMAQVFSGEITNWSQLGGLNASINMYRRDGNSGTTSLFDEMTMQPNGKQFSAAASILPSNSAVSDAVARDLNGIGISSIADERNARSVALRSVCGQVFTASDFTIKTEEYPLARRMFMYTRATGTPSRAAEFVDFITSSTAQEIAENAGFVGQNVSSVSLDHQGRRIANAIVAESDTLSLGNLQNLLTTILDAKRLSLTFRFISGTSTLDNRAQGDINRLARMIQDGDFSNRQILILGFTDNIGSADENARLSQARAEQVREAIIVAAGPSNLGNIRITPVGYGNISPLGCNETSTGRQTNRRVELWIR